MRDGAWRWVLAAWVLAAWVLAAWVLAAPAAAWAASGSGGEPGPTKGLDAGARISLWGTIRAGGPIGYVIIGMSVVGAALVVEHFLTINRGRLVPGALVRAVEVELESGGADAAREACARDGSYLGMVVEAGLAQAGSMFGFFDMQTAMQEASEREVSRLYRKLEYLSFIAATAPMLGLLGTVTGMIRSFNQIAVTEGAAKPSELAGGISEALVTTCMGLIVAIPMMFFVSLFRNRIDRYVAEGETVVERLMARFRKPNA